MITLLFCFLHQGGYFVWLEMPAHLNADDAAKLAFEKYDVQFITGKKSVSFCLFPMILLYILYL